MARHDRMVSLVEGMLDLHERVAAQQTSHAKTVLKRQIEATDRQIDALVYELYGLPQEEIAVVEGAINELDTALSCRAGAPRPTKTYAYLTG